MFLKHVFISYFSEYFLNSIPCLLLSLWRDLTLLYTWFHVTKFPTKSQSRMGFRSNRSILRTNFFPVLFFTNQHFDKKLMKSDPNIGVIIILIITLTAMIMIILVRRRISHLTWILNRWGIIPPEKCSKTVR